MSQNHKDLSLCLLLVRSDQARAHCVAEHAVIDTKAHLNHIYQCIRLLLLSVQLPSWAQGQGNINLEVPCRPRWRPFQIPVLLKLSKLHEKEVVCG
jgi:hypothetical protein